jgi:acetolactate synthase I/II/III large subunit
MSQVPVLGPNGLLDPRWVYAALDDALPRDRIVVCDTGRACGPLMNLIATQGAMSWITARGHGSTGLSLGYGLGISVANPDRPVAVFLGDHSFGASVGALESIRMNGAGLTAFVLNDGQLGAELRYLREFGLPADMARVQPPNVRGFAAAVGAEYFLAQDLEDLTMAANQVGVYTIVDVRIDPDIDPRDGFV